MLSGLIIYAKEDRLKNAYFIDRCLEIFASNNISLIYLDEEDVLDYLDDHHLDFVIYRSRNYRLLEQLEEKGIRCFNNSLTNKTANDKYLTYQFLKDHHFKCLPSFLSIDKINILPIVMKSRNGHGGQQVYLINSKQEADLKKDANNSYIYQPFFPNSGDLRVYVLNKKVIGSVLRNNNDDFRSNFSLGGEVINYQPNDEVVEMAIKIATLLDSDYIGVDFLKTKDGWLINEIEDPVGARMLYKASNIDAISLFCSHIIDSLLNHK